MECPNCNKTYDDDFKFCPYCGEEKPETLTCPKCQFKSAEFKFCPHCGEELIKDNIATEIPNTNLLIDYLKENFNEDSQGYFNVLEKIKYGEIYEIYQIDDEMYNAYLRKKYEKKTTTKQNQNEIEQNRRKKKHKIKIELYDYLNSLDNVKNRTIIERRIGAGQITTKEEIDAIRIPKPRRKYGIISVEEILEQKDKEMKQDLTNFVNNLNMDNIILKEEILKQIQEGKITTQDEINSILENERKELIKYVYEKSIEDKAINIVIIEKIKRGELRTKNQIDNKIKNIKGDQEYMRYVASHAHSVYHKGGGSSNYHPHAKWGW